MTATVGTVKDLPPLVCLTGIDGCGKSTHVRRLARYLESRHRLTAAHLHVWEIAQNPRYRSHPFISDREAVHRYLGLLQGGPRALFIFHGLLESLGLTRLASPDLIIANGYWYKYAFTEALSGTDPNWLQAVAGCFPRPDLTILLDLDPQTAWARKPEITPYECGFQPCSEEAFVTFQGRLRALLLEQAAREGWRIVSPDRHEDDVSADIIQIVEKEVIPHGRSPL